MAETTPIQLKEHHAVGVALFAGVDVPAYTGRQASRALRYVSAIKNAATALEGALALRVEETNAFAADGHCSAAHGVAAITGTSVGQAAATLRPRTASSTSAGLPRPTPRAISRQ